MEISITCRKQPENMYLCKPNEKITTTIQKSAMKIDQIENEIDELGDAHASSSAENPMKEDAFNLSDTEKIAMITEDVKHILDTLGMDLNDDSLRGTPLRVAKMFVKEIFAGLDPQRKPKASIFENKYKYGEMLVEKNITVYSTCEHHLLPIVGRAHVAYISNGSVIGLSKMNRIVDYYAKRPQVQERMTMQIVQELQKALGTEDVACVVDAKHLCVNSRGIRDIESSTVTSEFGGAFKDPGVRREFLDYIKLDTTF
jgi:GTP cyclohydrolase IA